jgi:uncharacterized protein YlzI (FlbEa/FlbD family)
MIRLTSIDGTPIYVNPNQITSIIEGSATHAEVYIAPEQFYCVSQSPEEVARKVLEWKLTMINYGAAYASLIREEGSANYEVDAQRDMLKLLAGLEIEL